MKSSQTGRLIFASWDDHCPEVIYSQKLHSRSGFEILDWKPEENEFVEGDELKLTCAASR